MPVYVPAVKRAKRRRERFEDSIEEQNRLDILSFLRACDKAAGKLTERTTTTEQHDPTSPTHAAKKTKVTFMEDPVDSQNLPLSHNSPSINQSANASPNRNRTRDNKA